MKRNHRKNRVWLSILLIVALMTPMLPSFAFAEEDVVAAEAVELELDAPQMAEMEADLGFDEAAAAEQAAAEEAARLAAEQAAAEEAARLAAEQAAAEEAARQAAEQAAAEEAARQAAEQAAAEEAARQAAEQAAAEEAARQAAEKAAAEEAARQAAEKAAAEGAAQPQPTAEEPVQEEATEEPTMEPTETPTEAPTEAPTVEPVTPAPVVAAAPAMAAMEASGKIIKSFSVTGKTEYFQSTKPTEAEAVALFKDVKVSATLTDNTTEALSVSWKCKDYASEKNVYDFEFALPDGYTLDTGVIQPKIELHVGDFKFEVDAEKNTAKIINWNGSKDVTKLEVPRTVEYNEKTYPVTVIGDSAFYGAENGLDKLVEITLPDSLTSVGTTIIDKDKVKTVRLSVAKETTLLDLKDGETAFAPTASGSDKTTIPFAITDIVVKKTADTAGVLTLDVSITPAGEHSVDIDEGGKLVINAGKTLTVKSTLQNKGTVVVKGKLANDEGKIYNTGAIYACYPGSGVEGEVLGNAVDFAHSIVEYVCEHCGVKDLSGATINDIANQSYTGTALEPNVTVKFGDATLVRDTDYTVAYANNTNAGEATATVTGKGDYINTASKTFKIIRSISEAVIGGVEKEYIYTGSAITIPTLTVTVNGVVLDPSNYSLDYTNHTNIGTATVKVTGQNYYSGSVQQNFDIVAVPIANVKVSGITAKTYTGTAIDQPDMVLTYNGTTLRKDTDYTVSYSSNTAVGSNTAKVKITGKGFFTGTREESFSINRASISGATVTGIEDKTYTGAAQTVAPTVVVNGNTLKSGTEYTVSYSNNTDAGSATVTITGVGNYTGSVSRSFNIAKKEQVVEIKLKSGHTVNKVYDKTRNLLLTSSDFDFSPAIASTEKMQIKKITGSYESADVGTYSIDVTFEVTQSTSKNYTYTLKDNKITISGKITPKQLTIRPGVAKSSTDSTLVSQTKVYGTADPSSYKAKVGGIMTGDSLSDAVKGALTRDSGEKVGKYKINIGTLKTQGNYATDPLLETGYFEITAKSVNATDVGMVAIGNQKYTGSAIEPEITLKYTKKVNDKTETETLVKGTDYTVKYSNNIQPGTGTVTITGRGNYTGTRTATFRILKVSTTTTSTTTSSTTTSANTAKTTTSTSASGSSGVSGEDDGDDEAEDEEEDEEESEKFKQRLEQLLAMPQEELEALAKSMNIDPADFDTPEELAREIIAYETEDEIGELVLDDQPYGTILFGTDDQARPFLLYEEVIHPNDSEDGKGDANSDKRLRIEALNMQDEEGNDLFLDEEETREKFEELHLRLTPNQIDVLKSKHFVELVYVVENAELTISLDELTPEIDVSPFERTASVKYVRPERDTEITDDEDEADDEIEVVEADDEDRTVLETVGMEMTPEMREVNQYDFCILQLVDDSMTDREKRAVGDLEATYAYRVQALAVNGEVKELAEGETTPAEEPEGAQDTLNRYPILGVMKSDELRIAMDEDPSDETQQVFVSDDETIVDDNEAIEYPEQDFVVGEESTYACFKPKHSGMYGVLNEDDFEPLPFVTYGPVNTPVPTATPIPEVTDEAETEETAAPEPEPTAAPEPTAEPEPTPTPEPTPEPAPEVIEDPDPVYAYSRRSNEGNQYWLVNTVSKTVEYYSATNDEYWTGEYTGSLMSGMDVKTNTGKSINIALKFQQTYKFALMNGDGPELLMEQDDVDAVTAELSSHR